MAKKKLDILQKLSTVTAAMGNIIDSLTGNSSTDAPSIRAVNEALNNVKCKDLHLKTITPEETTVKTYNGSSSVTFAINPIVKKTISKTPESAETTSFSFKELGLEDYPSTTKFNLLAVFYSPAAGQYNSATFYINYTTSKIYVSHSSLSTSSSRTFYFYILNTSEN